MSLKNFLSSFSAGISTAQSSHYIGYRGGGGQLGGQFIFQRSGAWILSRKNAAGPSLEKGFFSPFF